MILICEAQQRAIVNEFAETNGFGPNLLRYPLAPSPTALPSHYCCEWQSVDEDVLALFSKETPVGMYRSLDLALAVLQLARCESFVGRDLDGKSTDVYERLEAVWSIDLTRMKAEAGGGR